LSNTNVVGEGTNTRAIGCVGIEGAADSSSGVITVGRVQLASYGNIRISLKGNKSACKSWHATSEAIALLRTMTSLLFEAVSVQKLRFGIPVPVLSSEVLVQPGETDKSC